MIILEKQKDIAVLSAMGATMKFIRRLFIVEGMLVIAIGTVLGILAGAILCWLQQTYGLLNLGGAEGDFVIHAYPVKMKLSDLLIILSTLAIIGFLSSFVPARRINAAFASMNRQDKKAGL
jgi:lipoprotein-releasing system permease protein